jgi:Transcription factor WhiB
MTDFFDNKTSSCKDYPTEWWFPDMDIVSRHNANHALAICQTCPTITECLDYSLANETHGIWGGLREREREIERRKRGVSLTPLALSSSSNTTRRTARTIDRNLKRNEL